MVELGTGRRDMRPRPSRVEALRGVAAASPMLVGLVPVALALGAEASRKGLGPLEVLTMTGTNFAGGSEFAAVGLWTTPPHAAAIALTSLLINSRHVLMGATLAPHLRHLSRGRACLALFWMVDESWALALADVRRPGRGHDLLSVAFFAGAAGGLYLVWVSLTALGSAIGNTVGDVEAYGLDMAFPAVFLVLLRGLWRGWRPARAWLASLAVAASSGLVLPDAWHVAAGALAGVAVAYLTADAT